jgi:hypothetical protein
MASVVTSTPAEILDRLLDKGNVQSNENLEICCPDCVQVMNGNNVSVYVISSVETFLKFAEAIGFTKGLKPTCCTHLAASVETTLKFTEAFGIPENPVPTCSKNFNSCINTIKNTLTPVGIDRLLDKGVVEYGSLSGSSQICRINDFIDLSIELDPTSASKEEQLDRILDKGMVISCYDDEIVTASVETWLKWAEANGLTGGGSVPV